MWVCGTISQLQFIYFFLFFSSPRYACTDKKMIHHYIKCRFEWYIKCNWEYSPFWFPTHPALRSVRWLQSQQKTWNAIESVATLNSMNLTILQWYIKRNWECSPFELEIHPISTEPNQTQPNPPCTILCPVTSKSTQIIKRIVPVLSVHSHSKQCLPNRFTVILKMQSGLFAFWVAHSSERTRTHPALRSFKWLQSQRKTWNAVESFRLLHVPPTRINPALRSLRWLQINKRHLTQLGVLPFWTVSIWPFYSGKEKSNWTVRILGWKPTLQRALSGGFNVNERHETQWGVFAFLMTHPPEPTLHRALSTPIFWEGRGVFFTPKWCGII